MPYTIHRENREPAPGTHIVPQLPELLTVETPEEAWRALQDFAEQGVHGRVRVRARTPRNCLGQPERTRHRASRSAGVVVSPMVDAERPSPSPERLLIGTDLRSAWSATAQLLPVGQ